MSEGKPEREQITETREFIQFIKKLDEKQQIALNMTIEGLGLLAENKKAVKNR